MEWIQKSEKRKSERYKRAKLQKSELQKSVATKGRIYKRASVTKERTLQKSE